MGNRDKTTECRICGDAFEIHRCEKCGHDIADLCEECHMEKAHGDIPPPDTSFPMGASPQGGNAQIVADIQYEGDTLGGEYCRRGD